MRVECIQNCDADLGGGNRQALFAGQFYELSDDIAAPLVESGAILSAPDSTPRAKAEEPVEDKAEEPAEDKAVNGPPRNKARRTRRGS